MFEFLLFSWRSLNPVESGLFGTCLVTEGIRVSQKSFLNIQLKIKYRYIEEFKECLKWFLCQSYRNHRPQTYRIIILKRDAYDPVRDPLNVQALYKGSTLPPKGRVNCSFFGRVRVFGFSGAKRTKLRRRRHFWNFFENFTKSMYKKTSKLLLRPFRTDTF